MLSYEFYKFFHIIAIIGFFSLVGAQFLGDAKAKWIKILAGVLSFFILVGGMGLLARIGVNHGEGFPAWVWIKIVIWAIIAILTPVLNKRVGSKRTLAWLFILILGYTAAHVVINQ
ncbi:MAG: hypothetical protein ACPGJV_02250 [Bacteriovoracaceae bacterium]